MLGLGSRLESTGLTDRAGESTPGVVLRDVPGGATGANAPARLSGDLSRADIHHP